MAQLIGYLSEGEQLQGRLTIPQQLGGSTLGTKTITENDTYYAEDDGLDGYSEVTVNVSGGGGGTLETITKTYTPTTSQQTDTITPGVGYDGIAEVDVTVNAMPTGTEGTPTATKGAVSNHSVAVTPSVTNVAGYIAGGTKTGTAVTVSASELVSGTKQISQNGTGIDVTNYESVDVNVSGGGTEEAEWNDVRFWDYDGTLAYSYSASDFATLAALPTNPSHSGLTGKGWNWSLANAKTYVSKFGELDIGAMYTTTDGATKLYLEIANAIHLTQSVRVQASISNDVTIDWGDGTSETVSGTSAQNISHTYAETGKYTISIKASAGTVTFTGGTGNNILGSWGNSTSSRLLCLKKVIFGDKALWGTHVFQRCAALKTLVMPWDLEEIKNYVFDSASSLETFIIPLNVTTFGTSNLWNGNPGFKAISFNDKTSSTGISLQKNQALGTVKGLTPSANCLFYFGSDNPSRLQTVIVPDGVTAIPANAFRSTVAVTKVIIGSDVTSIGATAFMSCPITEMHLLPTTPPTLANTNAFANLKQDNAKWYVPYSADHSILNSYQTASNWSTFASYMMEEPA